MKGIRTIMAFAIIVAWFGLFCVDCLILALFGDFYYEMYTTYGFTFTSVLTMIGMTPFLVLIFIVFNAVGIAKGRDCKLPPSCGKSEDDLLHKIRTPRVKVEPYTVYENERYIPRHRRKRGKHLTVQDIKGMGKSPESW